MVIIETICLRESSNFAQFAKTLFFLMIYSSLNFAIRRVQQDVFVASTNEFLSLYFSAPLPP